MYIFEDYSCQKADCSGYDQPKEVFRKKSEPLHIERCVICGSEMVKLINFPKIGTSEVYKAINFTKMNGSDRTKYHYIPKTTNKQWDI